MNGRRLVVVFVSLVLLVAFLSTAYGEFAFVDLKPTANSKIMNTSWWTRVAGSSDFDELYEIAKDGHEFEMENGDTVPFKIEDAVLVVFGTNSPTNPVKIEGIEVGMSGDALYFVHMTAWETQGVPSYKFVMHYEGGGTEELEMQNLINSEDWCNTPAQLSDKNSTQIWTENGVTCGTVAVIATKWPNPNSGKVIKTVDFVSLETGAVPALFAITVSGASAAVSPGGKLTMTWAGLKLDF